MKAMSAQRPWYKEPWLLFLAAPPLATVLFWAVILSSMAERPALVMDDYSRVGLALAETRQRDAAAVRLGVAGRLQVQRAEGRVAVALTGLAESPARLELRLIHPTDGARDRVMTLDRDPAGVYRAEMPALPVGRRYVQLGPPDGEWRLAGELGRHGESLTLTPPSPAGG